MRSPGLGIETRTVHTAELRMLRRAKLDQISIWAFVRECLSRMAEPIMGWVRLSLPLIYCEPDHNLPDCKTCRRCAITDYPEIQVIVAGHLFRSV